MDEVTRLKVEIDQGMKRLRRLDATPYASNGDRRDARQLAQSLERKKETLRRLQAWLTPRR